MARLTRIPFLESSCVVVEFRPTIEAPIGQRLSCPDECGPHWRAHDRILRCRINAAFRSQVERRIYAAERGARRNLSCAPHWIAANSGLDGAGADWFTGAVPRRILACDTRMEWFDIFRQ